MREVKFRAGDKERKEINETDNMELFLAEVRVVESGNKWYVLVKATEKYAAQTKVENKYDFKVKVFVSKTIE